MRKMASRANPTPKDTPKYWRMPIVMVLRWCNYMIETVGKRGDEKWVITV
jgi:hypothetical protein